MATIARIGPAPNAGLAKVRRVFLSGPAAVIGISHRGLDGVYALILKTISSPNDIITDHWSGLKEKPSGSNFTAVSSSVNLVLGNEGGGVPLFFLYERTQRRYLF